MGAELPVRITADLSQFEKDLGAAQKGTRAITTEAKGLEHGLELAHSKARLLGGALKVISPELGLAVREVGHLSGALALAGKSAGGLYGILAGGTAIAAAAVIYKSYEAIAGQIEEAEKKQLASSNEAIKAEVNKASAIQYVNKAIVHNEQEAALEKKKIYWESARIAIAASESVALATFRVTSFVVEQVGNLFGEQIGYGIFDRYRDSLDTLKVDLQGYIDAFDTGAIDDEIAVQKAATEQNVELAKSYEKLKKEKKSWAEFEKEWARAYEKVMQEDEALRKDEIRATAELAEKQGTVSEQIKERHAKEAVALRATLAGFEQAAAGAEDLGQTLDKQGKLSQSGAIALAIVTRAAATASIAAHVGEAIAAALPLLSNPITAPYGIAAEAAAVAGGALAEAAVIAKPIPSPQYHSGGVVRISAQDGEGVVNRHGMRRLGPAGLDELNRGGSSAATDRPIQITQMLTHRSMDSWWLRSVSRMYSPTRAAVQKIETGVRPGHRQRVG